MTAIDVTAATAWVTAILGVLAPIITAVVNRPAWSAQTRRIIALVVAVVLAIAGFFATGGASDLTVQNLLAVVLAVIALSQTTFALIWKPTGTAVSVELATAPKPAPWVSDAEVLSDKSG